MGKTDKKISLYPRSESEYLKVFRWKISKRLILAIVLLLGFISILYIIPSALFQDKKADKVKTYNYDSILLPYISGNVKIRAAAGYIAYEGEVDKGYVTGKGTLYSDEGQIIYEGEFKENEYSGNGKLYGDGGRLIYEGEFLDNLYEGKGIEYEDDITYEGDFVNGKRDGDGELKSISGNNIYKGSFSEGEILYSSFLGKTTEEMSGIYEGKRDIYYNDECFLVHMKDIKVFYSTFTSEDTIEDKVNIKRVFILKDTYSYGEEKADNIEMLSEIMGEPSYEGNLYINAEEAAVLGEDWGLKTEKVFEEVFEIKDYDRSAVLYVYDFRWQGIKYTFYCKEKNGSFIMYSIEEIKE